MQHNPRQMNPGFQRPPNMGPVPTPDSMPMTAQQEWRQVMLQQQQQQTMGFNTGPGVGNMRQNFNNPQGKQPSLKLSKIKITQ